MVMSFFRKSESGLEQIAHQTISMLGDARTRSISHRR